MSTDLLLECGNCQKQFPYARKEYNRQKKKYHREVFFCSVSCARVYRNKNRSAEEQAKISAAISQRSLGNSYGRKGQFTYYLARARRRLTDLDETYLAELWETQRGLCAITGLPIQLKSKQRTPDTASLDRIDSAKDYIKGNVQFVAYVINLAKNNFADADIRTFIGRLRA